MRRKSDEVTRACCGADGEAELRLSPTVSRPELLEDGRDHRLRQLIYDLFVLSTHVDTIRKRVAGLIGLTPPQYSIVMVVAQYQQNRGASVGAVAAHLHVTSAFVATETNKLVRKGFFTKRPKSGGSPRSSPNLIGGGGGSPSNGWQSRRRALPPQMSTLDARYPDSFAAEGRTPRTRKEWRPKWRIRG